MYALIMTIGLATITCLAGEFLPQGQGIAGLCDVADGGGECVCGVCSGGGAT